MLPGGAREVFKRKGEAYTLRYSDSPAGRIAAKFNTIVPLREWAATSFRERGLCVGHRRLADDG